MSKDSPTKPKKPVPAGKNAFDEDDMDLKKTSCSATKTDPHMVEEFDGVDEEPNKHKPLPVKKSAAECMDDVSKALSSRIVAGLAKRARMEAAVHAYNFQAENRIATSPDVPGTVGIAQPQPVIGTNRVQSLHEPLNVPVRMIVTELQPVGNSEVYKSCESCGRMTKSLTCITCDNRNTGVAVPVWRR